MSESKKCQNYFFFSLSSCIQQNICLAPHRLIAQMLTAEGTLKWAFFWGFFCASGRKSGGREGVRDHDGFTNTRVDTQHTEILPGHLLRKSRILLSQELHFLSGPGWVSNLLIAAVTTKWSSCESGNQLPRRVFAPPPSSLLCMSDTMEPLCLCICRHGAPPAPGFRR